ncbi:MAG TPA: hypothetical protein VFM21_12170 [Terriglobia bacterium]|nr:hypothetical protein [Terriglobia bacterium]
MGTPPLQQPGDHRSPLQVEAVLYGTTYSGQRIRGSGMVRIVPAVQTSAPTFPRGRGTVTNNLASTVLPRGQGRPAGTH